MKYLILIHQNRGARDQFASFPPEVQAAGMQAYYDLNAALAATGELVSAEALADDSTGTVLSLKSGSIVTSDGPFAESKEMLAGFYLVDVASLDRALEIAAMIPEVQAGAGDVEVRPVMDTAAMA
ncbi:MAG TPA: YciI family protein [Propionicimonas sp.]|jgi:hypothetical protein|uniref:YciI family protein n=1 Tax=Propionicimonas sp. TaxID=1955623 RepID=UPI002F41B478